MRKKLGLQVVACAIAFFCWCPTKSQAQDPTVCVRTSLNFEGAIAGPGPRLSAESFAVETCYRRKALSDDTNSFFHVLFQIDDPDDIGNRLAVTVHNRHHSSLNVKP